MPVELPHFPIGHASLDPSNHARSAVRYLRFLREVTIDTIELAPVVHGRWAPSVPTHPAHLVVSALDEPAARWRVVRDVELPPDPRISGQGLSQDMGLDEMEAHFRAVMASAPARVVELGGIHARTLKVECDREHPVWPSHGECNGNPTSIPFGILDSLKAFGPAPASDIPDADWNPLLRALAVSPRAPRGMSVRQVGQMLLFEGSRLSVGFSLRRPVMLHLGWDSLGKGLAGRNRLSGRRVRFRDQNRGVSGPIVVGLDGDYGSHRWTGSVEVRGNRVFYRGLHAFPRLRVDAAFTVLPDRILLELLQAADRDLPVLEAEAWRLAFTVSAGMTGVAGVPTCAQGRPGDVRLPALLAGDGNGALRLRATGGDLERAGLQAESWRSSGEVTAGITLGGRPGPGECLVVPRGSLRVEMEIDPISLEPAASLALRGPASRPGGRSFGPGIRRHWGSQFSCFRPELGGFSNNAVSVNCHPNQHTPIDLAAFTRVPEGGPDPLDLARFTIGRAISGAGGYGFWHSLCLDSDPVLVCSAGRIHQAGPDPAWLRAIGPGLSAAVLRMLGTIDAETGLSRCRDLSGNSGSFRWSCNAWDIVGFGHLDAYVNAWTYRALRNAAALLEDLGDPALSRRCRDAAAGIGESYGRVFVNPGTGWAACWKSRDGVLHDYASPLVNGPACAFGVLRPAEARRALDGLERLRDELGLAEAGVGIPYTLRPIDPADHLLPRIMGGGKTEPTFECYTDGSMGASAAAFYLRALSIHGFAGRAARMAAEMDRSFADGVFTGPPGGVGDGREFQTWEGLTTGYEGTFGPTFGVLYAVAVQQGIITPPSPEWWPENG